MDERPEIYPMMKVAELLHAYPEVEGRLLELSPSLEKLKSPALLATVAKVTTLEQAAKESEYGLVEFIQELRMAVGLAGVEECPDPEAREADAEASQTGGRPAWADEALLSGQLDARPILARGEHPLEHVLAEVARFQKGQVYRLTTPFLPAPLVQKVQVEGFDSWSEEASPGQFESWFRKQ